MEFSEKGPMDPMNGHFSPPSLLMGYNFHFVGALTNLIFAHRVMFQCSCELFRTFFCALQTRQCGGFPTLDPPCIRSEV